MQTQADLPRFWSSDAPKWNFGDAIAYFLRRRLFLDVAPFSKDPWTVGSVLFDGAPLISTDRDNPELPSFFDDRPCEAIFWGCGIREPGSLSKEFAEHCAILAVRGPLSASDLRLGAEIPMGDPALLLPALYQPRRRHAFVGKSVCVPHYQDARSDCDIAEASGCDLVLRPAIMPDLSGIEEFIDALTSADFVLCGSMHGAIAAAAYGVPFGYWDSGNVDIRFKWEDLSSLLGIQCRFSPDINSAKQHYENEIRPKIELPSVWGLLGSAPLPIRPSALLRIVRYELSRHSGEAAPMIEHALQEFVSHDRHSDHFVALSRKLISEIVPTLMRERDLAQQQFTDKAAENERMQSEYANLNDTHLSTLTSADETTRALLAATARAESSEQEVQTLLSTHAALKEEIELLRAEWARLDQQIHLQSARDVAAKEAHALEVQALRSEMQAISAERTMLHNDLLAWRSESVVREQHALDERSRLAEELISQHEAALAENASKLEVAKQALQASSDEVAALKGIEAERDRLNADVEALRLELHSRSTERDAQSRLVEELIAEHEAALAESESKLQLVKQALSVSIEQVAALEGMETERDRLKEGNETLRSEVQSLSAERDVLRNDLDAWRSETVVRERRALEQRSRLSEQLAAKHQTVLAESASKPERANQALPASNERVAALSGIEAEREHLKAEVETAHRRLSDLESHAAEIDQARRIAEDRAMTAIQMTDVIRGDMAHALAQRDAAAAQIGKSIRRLRANKWFRRISKFPVLAKYDRRLHERAALIEGFLGQFSDTQLGMSAQGRADRIVAYLLGATPYIADFPLLDRDIYRTLHPDVAEAGVDPFVHYLENGHKEGRTPHPLLDYDYYTRFYPETGRYGQSIVEHYIRFGAAKNYDPSPMFSTKEYFNLHPDVKITGYNPLIHYLRNPDCRPHPYFDSQYYRVSNLDVVRSGFNPLVHFLLYGRKEGRRPTRDHGGAQSISASTAVQEAARLEIAVSAMPASLPEVSSAQTLPALRPLVLMMDAFYPRPDHDSGSLDQVNFVKIFQSLGYDVAFAALMDFAPTSDASAALRGRGVHCVTGADYISIEEFVVLNRERISTFFLSRFNFGGSWIERARSFCPRARVVLNTVDLHHVREERQAKLTGDPVAASSASMTKEAELAAISAADVSIVVSQVERDILDQLLPAADVRVIPLIREVKERAHPSFEERKGIAFVGGFQHLPNIDAVTYFLDEIWPRILTISPEITLHVIGSHMPEAFRERSDHNVDWVGFVPELEPWLDRVRLTVAPLRYGAGAKGKVVSSLLNGVPCVATSIAAEGMGFDEGEGVVVAGDAEKFAELVGTLHSDKKQWTSLSQRGFAAVCRSYSLDQGITLMEQILPRVSAREGAQE